MDPILMARCDPVDTFGVALRAFEEAEAPTLIWEAQQGEPRPSLEGVGGVVMFGSTYNVEHADEQPFIKDLAEVTLEASDRRLPYLGVCFGSQLLAWSLGAEIMKAPTREVGFEPIHPTPAAADDPLLGHLSDGDMLFQWHMDTFELPDGAELLVTGDRVRNQAYRVGDRTWATQFHFEVDAAEIGMWLDVFSREEDLLSRWGKTVEQVLEEREEHVARHEELGSEIFRRFAGLAREAT